MKTLGLSMIAALSVLAAPAFAMDPDPTTFTCGDWVAANESVQLSFFNNVKAYANDAANAATTAELQATISSLADTDARTKIDAACDGKPVDQVVIDLLKMN